MARQRKDRFYNVLRTIGYSQANKDYFINYLRGLTDAPELTGEGTSRGAKTVLYVEPFSIPLAATTVAKESALSNAWSALGSISPVGTYVTTALGGNDVYDSTGYSAPRISRKILGVKEVNRSKFTNKQYRARTGSANSIPFGKNGIGDTAESVYQILAAAMVAGNANARTTLIPERF